MITECWTPQSNHRDTFIFTYICKAIIGMFFSLYTLVLIIPKYILFKQVTANNVQYGSDSNLFDHQMGGTVPDFNLQFEVIDN